jgi:hypothetical protein
MKYRVIIPRAIKEKIEGWPVPRRFMVVILNRLKHELECDPERHIRYIRDYKKYQYSFTLKDEMHERVTHLFLFYLDYHQGNSDIVLNDCSYLKST